MKTAFVLFAAAAISTAAASPSSQQREPDARPSVRSGCENAIAQVRASTGLSQAAPPIAPRETMLIAAVDKRIDGCRTLVMANDHRDIRPEPGAGTEARLLPAR